MSKQTHIEGEPERTVNPTTDDRSRSPSRAPSWASNDAGDDVGPEAGHHMQWYALLGLGSVPPWEPLNQGRLAEFLPETGHAPVVHFLGHGTLDRIVKRFDFGNAAAKDPAGITDSQLYAGSQQYNAEASRLLLEAARSGYLETLQGKLAKDVAEALSRMTPEELSRAADRGAAIADQMLDASAKEWVRKK